MMVPFVVPLVKTSDDEGRFSYKYEAIATDVISLLLDVQWFTSLEKPLKWCIIHHGIEPFWTKIIP